MPLRRRACWVGTFSRSKHRICNSSGSRLHIKEGGLASGLVWWKHMEHVDVQGELMLLGSC